MLPAQYQWLETISPPNTIKEALKLYGTLEKIGPQNNPVIMGWASECGISGYTGDDVPWCGLFAAVVAKRAGWDIVDQPLWARNWSKFGNQSLTPSLGDILTFSRDGGGHVGFYIAEDTQTYHVLGGNQSDSVCIIRLNKARLLSARQPAWKIAKPASVKPYRITASGVISENEA